MSKLKDVKILSGCVGAKNGFVGAIGVSCGAREVGGNAKGLKGEPAGFCVAPKFGALTARCWEGREATVAALDFNGGGEK